MLFMAMVATGGRGDVTPDAVNWGHISNGTADGENADQTITGITGSIRLHFDVTVTSGSGILRYHLNGGGGVSFADNDTLMVSDGDTLHFSASATIGLSFQRTVSVKNAFDGFAELDSFAVSLVGE